MANPEPSPETRFPAGASGNPAGRPRGSLSLTAILRRKLAEAEGDRTVAEAIVDALIRAARAGDHRHIKEIIDRTEGKVPDKLEQSGGLTVRVEYADPDDHPPEAAPGAAGDPEGDAPV